MMMMIVHDVSAWFGTLTFFTGREEEVCAPRHPLALASPLYTSSTTPTTETTIDGPMGGPRRRMFADVQPK